MKKLKRYVVTEANYFVNKSYENDAENLIVLSEHNFERLDDFAESQKYSVFTKETLDDCREFVCGSIKQNNPDPFMEEYIAAEKLFDSYFELGLKGAFLTVEDKIVATAVGENNFGTAIIHL